VEVIKPLGDIFLNLLLAIIPLIFFTIASSIASLEKSEKLGKLFVVVIGVLSTVVISAVLMMVGVLLFPIHQDIIISNSIRKHEVLVRVSNHRVAHCQ
jgi:Na+/H+-dicarboxylate symporter